VRAVGDVDGDGRRRLRRRRLLAERGDPPRRPPSCGRARPVSRSSRSRVTSRSRPSPRTEYFSHHRAARRSWTADGSGGGRGLVAWSQPLAPRPRALDLRVMRASGRLARCRRRRRTVARSAVRRSVATQPSSVSGCLESSGTIQIDAYGSGDPLLFVSAITGSIPLPGSCALTIGLPAIVVPLPKSGDHYTLNAHLPSFSTPVTLHLQSAGWQNSGSPNLAASGRSTLTLP
jgi:hypothetical protein